MRHGRRLEAENQLLRSAGDEDFIAEAPAMRAVLDTVERIAPSDAYVLITGENGTGKGLIARLDSRAVAARRAALHLGEHGQHSGDACSRAR